MEAFEMQARAGTNLLAVPDLCLYIVMIYMNNRAPLERAVYCIPRTFPV